MQLPTTPRMRNLDTVLDRSRFIWERQPVDKPQ